jgi:alginate O-acetyltransferase complex protein AlgJ
MRSPPFAGIFDSWAYERKVEGERVLIIGDSTEMGWKDFFMRSDAACIDWLHHGGCTFDWRDVARFYPTLIILAPTERTFACDRDTWPVRLAGPLTAVFRCPAR